MSLGEIGSAVLPYLAGEGACALWWVVLGPASAVILWAVLPGGAR